MKLSRFQVFESGLGLTLVKQGIVPINWLIKFNTYKAFRELTDTGMNREQAISQTAVKCRCNISSVRRYIYTFERDDPYMQDVARK